MELQNEMVHITAAELEQPRLRPAINALARRALERNMIMVDPRECGDHVEIATRLGLVNISDPQPASDAAGFVVPPIKRLRGHGSFA